MVQAVSQWMWREGSFRIVSYIVWGRKTGQAWEKEHFKTPWKDLSEDTCQSSDSFCGFFSTFDTHNSLKLQKE